MAEPIKLQAVQAAMTAVPPRQSIGRLQWCNTGTVDVAAGTNSFAQAGDITPYRKHKPARHVHSTHPHSVAHEPLCAEHPDNAQTHARGHGQAGRYKGLERTTLSKHPLAQQAQAQRPAIPCPEARWILWAFLCAAVRPARHRAVSQQTKHHIRMVA